MNPPSISVIVVNWNGRRHLLACLSALLHQTFMPKEILFVDNGSQDDSSLLVQDNFPSVQILQLKENRGFSGGNNVGIKHACGELIALINNDTEADPRWLEESVKALNEYPNAGFTASRICLYDHREYLDAAGDLYFRSGYPGKRGWLQRYGDEYSKSKWVFGACAGAAVYRREMLDQIGLFDEDYFNYQEDTDLSFRAQLFGYRCLYVPTAIVYHKVSATSGFRSPHSQYWSHRNHWYTLIKNLPASLWVRYFGQILLSDILVFGSSIHQGRLRIFIRARLDVLKFMHSTLKKRQKIQSHRIVSIEYLDSIIQKNWFSYRIVEKQKEKEFQMLPKK